VDVPIRLEGQPVGVEKGGMLEQLRHDLTVSCLPSNMPEAIVVDVSNMDIGDPLHVSDLKLAESIEVQAESDLTIATVVAPHVEKEPVEEAEEAEAVETEEAGEGGES
jgi:large subunit ribosomal protein L25